MNVSRRVLVSSIAPALLSCAIFYTEAAAQDVPVGPSPVATVAHWRQVYGTRSVTFTKINPLEWQATLSVSTTPIAAPTLAPAPAATPTPRPPARGLTTVAFGAKLNETQTKFNTFRTQTMPALNALIDSLGSTPTQSDVDRTRKLESDDKATLDGIAQLASDLQNGLGAPNLNANDVQSATTLINNVTQYYGKIAPILNLQPLPTSIEYQVDCGGLQGNGQLAKVLLTLTPTDPLVTATSIIKEVDVTCPPTVALAAGVSFTTLGEYAYAAEAGPLLAGATPPPTSVVTQSPPGSRPFRAHPGAYVHFTLPICKECDSAGFAFTLVGAPVISSSSGSGAPFLEGGGGFSFSLNDHTWFTLGEYYGSVTVPKPGFVPGSIVPTGTSIPTQSVPKWSIFLGISGRLP